MEKQQKADTGEILGGDDLDDAVSAADDTGMVSNQQTRVAEEILLGEEGKSVDDED